MAFKYGDKYVQLAHFCFSYDKFDNKETNVFMINHHIQNIYKLLDSGWLYMYTEKGKIRSRNRKW